MFGTDVIWVSNSSPTPMAAIPLAITPRGPKRFASAPE